MFAVLMAGLLAVLPMAGLDLPPEIVGGADVTVTAERGTTVQAEPVAPGPPQFANNCDEMTFYRQMAGLPASFDRIGWRESNCRNEEGVHTSCCWGYWQLHVSLHLRDSRLAGRYHDCGVYSRYDVDSDTPEDKMRQACAAKALYDTVGSSAWAATR